MDEKDKKHVEPNSINLVNSVNYQNMKNSMENPSTYQPNYFADMMINTQIAKSISSFDLKKGITLNNIILLVTLFSISEIKGFCKILYGEFGLLFKNNYKQIFYKVYNTSASCFNGIYYNLFWWKKNIIKLNIQKPLEMIKSPKNYAYYNLNTMVEFTQGLINILNKQNNEIYTNHVVSKNVNIEFQNMETEIIKEVWSDIYIDYSGISIKLNNILELSFRNNKEKKLINVVSIKNEKKEININVNDINYFHQLIDDPIISAIIECLHMENKPNYYGNHDKNIQFDIIQNKEYILKMKLEFNLEHNKYVNMIKHMNDSMLDNKM